MFIVMSMMPAGGERRTGPLLSVSRTKLPLPARLSIRPRRCASA
jgi:hypothetical protein